jgi:tetratricopeptide (TPR) repeat protein
MTSARRIQPFGATAPCPSPVDRGHLPNWIAGAVLATAAIAAYWNGLSGPFVFDDLPSIVENPTIRHLQEIGAVLRPPHEVGLTVSGRPMLNLSFALNYWLSDRNPWSYHVLNLVIHFLAALTLFGIVRRTLQQPTLRARFGAGAFPVALATAVLWMLHPLQTESVTYVSQRAESLMGLSYLLTVYLSLRDLESPRPSFWSALAVAAGLLGMATKEVMASVPVIVLLYDRTFVAGSFRTAWQRRRRFYLALAATWLLLGYLVVSSANRGGTAGFGTEASWWAYALTQCRAVVHYLQLSVWPHPLVFDYGTAVVNRVGEVWPEALGLLLLATSVMIALWRQPPLGFLGAWFFAILAPSSSVVSVSTQTAAEHRMYLPLAAVIALAVVALHALPGRSRTLLVGLVAFSFAMLTVRRNADYRTDYSLWENTIAWCPTNPRAYTSLGNAYARDGLWLKAIPLYEHAVHMQPDFALAHNNLGAALSRAGRTAEALAQYEEADRLMTGDPDIEFNVGCAYLQANRLPAAITHLAAALRSRPGFAAAENNLGEALARVGRPEEAFAHFGTAVRLQPNNVEALLNWGNALVQANRLPDAATRYQEALRLKPDLADLHYNLANVWLAMNRLPEAETAYREALRLQPDSAAAHHNYAQALVRMGRPAEALAHFEATVRQLPSSALAHHNLASTLATLGRVPEAIREEENALRLDPALTAAWENLARLRQR